MDSEELSGFALQGVVYSIATLAQLILQVLQMMYVGRVLGPEGYAIYLFSYLPSSTFMLFVDPGVTGALVRYASIYRSRGDTLSIMKYFRFTLLTMLSISSAFSIALVMFPSQLGSLLSGREDIGSYVALTAPLLPASAAAYAALALFIALQRALLRSALLVSWQALRFAITIALIQAGLGVAGALLGNVISTIAIAVAAFITSRDVLLGGTRSVFPEDLRGFIKLALSLYFIGLWTGVVGRVVQIRLGHLTSDIPGGDYIAGNFQASSSSLGAILAVLGSLSTPLVPFLASSAANGNSSADTKRLAAIYLKAMLLITVPIAAYALLFSSDIIDIVYGRRYAEAPIFFTIMGISIFYWVHQSAYLSYFNVMNDARVLAIYGTSAGLVGVVMAVAFSEVLGLRGLALASAIYQLPSTIYVGVLAYRRHGLAPLLGFSAKAIAVSFASSLITLFVKQLLPGYSLLIALVTFPLHIFTYTTLLIISGTGADEALGLLQGLASNIPLFGGLLGLFIKYYCWLRKVVGLRTSGD